MAYLALTLTLTHACLAEEKKVEIESLDEAFKELANPSFEKRQEAEKKIIQQFNTVKDKKVIETHLDQLFRKHLHLKDPEKRVRLYAVMKALVIHYKKSKGRPFMGVGWNQNGQNHYVLTEDKKTLYGLRINSVTPNTAAETAGLKYNDCIVQIDDINFRSTRDMALGRFKDTIRSFAAGDTVRLTYYRDKVEKTTLLTFGKVPDDLLATIDLGEPATSNETSDTLYFLRWYKQKNTAQPAQQKH